MNLFQKIAVTFLAVTAMLGSTQCHAAVTATTEDNSGAAEVVTKEDIHQYIQTHGHDPSLSPEQLVQLAKQDKMKKKDVPPPAAAATKPMTTTTTTTNTRTTHEELFEKDNKPVVTHEELIQHINKHGHNPDLSPEQIYKRIREEKRLN